MRSVVARLKVVRGRLVIDNFSVRVRKGITVLAIGKASYPMISAALRVLGKQLTSGILVAPKTEEFTGLDERIIAFRTGHPIPDEEGVRASRHVIASIGRMHTDDLLLCLISGGASAMLPAPADDVTLDDKKRVTQRLIRSRASIHEVNTVRRHLSKLKGGGLVKLCRAGRVLSLIVSDVPGNSLADIASGLTSPDPTTYQDAINVLKEYDSWNSAPRNVRSRLLQGSAGKMNETPKPGDKIFRKVHNVIITDNRTACEAMRANLSRRGVRTTLLTSSMNMEARSLGRLLASIASEREAYDRTLRRPSALILGGETTVDVKGNGKGGRNQEVALASINGIAGLSGVAIATMGTDGVDGNSPAAGAVVDGRSMTRAIRLGMQIRRFAAENDSYGFFNRLGDSIVTGPTGTNVGDVCVLVRTR
jgi:glycerate-2-kinase